MEPKRTLHGGRSAGPLQLLYLLLIAGLLAGCARGRLTATPTVAPDPPTGVTWPTQDWQSASPESQGMDSEMLGLMLDAIQQQGLALHSLLIIRHGYLVSETYFSNYTRETRHELYSCTKSFVSTLVGIAIDQGAIAGISDPVLDFFPRRSIANLDAEKQSLLLADVLTMRTGLDWDEGDPAYMALATSRDWLQYMLDLPMTDTPGVLFNYCSGCSHLLSGIVQQATGENPEDFAKKNLFEPLGITNYVWDTDSQGLPVGGWGLQLTPREMAKLGYLFLNEGQWDGRQVVSTNWVEQATATHVDAGDGMGYGYQWWTITSLGAYAALGLYGQTILVVPEEDLVVVTTAQIEDHAPIFQLIGQYLLPAEE